MAELVLVRPLRHAIYIVTVFGMVACSTRTLVSIDTSYGSHGLHTTATFRVPVGWSATQSPLDRFAWGIAPSGAPKALRKCAIDLHYYLLDDWQPQSQEGQAKNYLDAVHHHNDPAVISMITDSFDSSRYGRLHVYRFYSDYWRDRRAVFIVSGRRYVHVELYAYDTRDAAACQNMLEEVARSVTIR